MTTKEAIEILYSEATSEDRAHSREEIEQAKQQLEKEFDNYDPVEDARAYCLQLFKDKPKFIKLGSHTFNLKEIKEYSIYPTRKLGILPDGTRGVDEGWGLMIRLYSGNGCWAIGCGTEEEAEKLQEKLDNIIGVIDLEKEKQ